MQQSVLGYDKLLLTIQTRALTLTQVIQLWLAVILFVQLIFLLRTSVGGVLLHLNP